jgi:uncharacterized damage-inducible protein DinB
MTTDEHGRPEPPIDADEASTLIGFLEYQRATLTAAGLRAGLHPTTMTLGGLLKHLALVEQHWFSGALHGLPPTPPWSAVDWAQDPDWEWRTAAQDGPEQLRALWEREVARSRERVAAALAAGGLDFVATGVLSDTGETMRLRWIVLHMIEEYARHNGHADLLRESVDGSTGE